MKDMKRIGALLLTLVMVLAVSATAVATEGTYSTAEAYSNGDTKLYNYNFIGTDIESINIPINICVSCVTKLPAMSFDFTVASGPAVTSTSPAIQAGPAGVVTVTPLTIAKGATSKYYSNGTPEGNVTLTFDKTKFTAGGIYRYSLTENYTSNIDDFLFFVDYSGTVGTVTYYLDLYVSGESSDLKITNAVLFYIIDNNYNYTTGSLEPTWRYGFFDYENSSSKIGELWFCDYESNIYIHNNIEGTYADSDYAFTYEFRAAENGGTSFDFEGLEFKPFGKNNSTTLVYGANQVATDTFTLTGSNYKEFQVPVGVNILVNQTNGASDGWTTYVESSGVWDLCNEEQAEEANSTNLEAIRENYDNSYKENSISVGSEREYGFVGTFLNVRDTISPTGIILRFAPYILMLGVGIFLFILGRKRRKDDAEQA